MKPKNILVFGATGQIGRNLVRKLTKKNYKVTAVTRNIHQKGYILKTQAPIGYLDLKECSIFDENKIKELISKCHVCVNLIGILYEKRKNTFNNIHKLFPGMISNICAEYKIENLVHLSALGIDAATDSKYAKSKLDGEKEIKKNFQKALIVRPSIVYSVDDNFTTLFMTLLNRLPFFPLYYKGNTKFSPIHCTDMAEIISTIIEKNINSQTVECIGPEQITFKEIVKSLLEAINKKRILVPVPLFFANLLAFFLELMPNPLLTKDQIKLLKYDNIESGNFKTNFDLKIPSKLYFKNEVNKYSYMWKERGQFS